MDDVPGLPVFLSYHRPDRDAVTRNLTREEWRQYVGNEPYRKTFPNLP